MDKTIKLACLLAIIIFSSCASRKDFVYLQDMDELQEYPMVQKYEAIIHRDDRLRYYCEQQKPRTVPAFQYVRKQKLFCRSRRKHFQQ